MRWLANPCLFRDSSPAAVHGCRRDFIEAWTSLNTALSGGLHITNVNDGSADATMIAIGVDTHTGRHVFSRA